MKSSLIIAAILAVTCAERINIDWTQVRPIEDFDHYWSRLAPRLQALRKPQPDRRITHGQVANPGQFPYQAVLFINVTGGQALCGGSILSRNYILTAAHCVQETTGGYVGAGVQNFNLDEPSEQWTTFGKSGIQYHAGYNPSLLRNDIATIRVNYPLTYTARIQPVRLPAVGDNRQFDGVMGTVSGHGRTEGGYISEVLRFTSNPIMSQQGCLAIWQFPEVIQAQNICLENTGGRSSCNGDSGGPLTVQDGASSMQVGIVSFGDAEGCSVGTPSVYARVSYFRDWIKQHSDIV